MMDWIKRLRSRTHDAAVGGPAKPSEAKTQDADGRQLAQKSLDPPQPAFDLYAEVLKYPSVEPASLRVRGRVHRRRRR